MSTSQRSARLGHPDQLFGHDRLERGEYDGSEWWEYKELPVKPLQHRAVKTVIGGMWASLERIETEP
jgi:hypothetical protein